MPVICTSLIGAATRSPHWLGNIGTDNIEHAKQIIPWKVRGKARIVKIEKFEAQDPIHPLKRNK